ncbi:MAG TPA: YceI family protein [Ktedonobacterales bacterium]|nr:YceI family protein [Ktedonobacterales bacterium]
MAWQLDKAHTEVGFAVKHMMVSTVRGRFKQFDGTIELDEGRPETSRVDVTIDLASIETGDEKRDGHLRSADFFDVARYPKATFTSTRIEPLGEDHARVFGNLTIHGVTREIPLDVTLEGQGRDMQGQRRAGFSLTGSFNRKDFGLGWNVALETGGWVVSETVKLTIDAEVLEPATPPAVAAR